MPPNLWAFPWAELRRPARSPALLTLAGIAISVAGLTATSSACSAVRAAYRDLFTGLNGSPGLEASAPGNAPFAFDDSTPGELIPGVRFVEPRIQATAALVDKAGAVPALVLGTDHLETVGVLGAGRSPVATTSCS